MAGAVRTILAAGTIAALLLGSGAASSSSEKPESGQEWMSWSPAERTIFIAGFIDGYLRGTHQACLAADNLFEVGKPHRLGDQDHPSDMPSARCLAEVDTYSKYKRVGSKVDFSSYTDVITEFYGKHPEYQSIPNTYLLRFLSDRQYKTADQLYQMALKGEIRTSF